MKSTDESHLFIPQATALVNQITHSQDRPCLQLVALARSLHREGMDAKRVFTWDVDQKDVDAAIMATDKWIREAEGLYQTELVTREEPNGPKVINTEFTRPAQEANRPAMRFYSTGSYQRPEAEPSHENGAHDWTTIVHTLKSRKKVPV